LAYVPIEAAPGIKTADYPYYEMISKKILDHLQAFPYPFNAKKIDAGQYVEVTDSRPISNSNLPMSLVPLLVIGKPSIVGLFSGGYAFEGGVYRPTAWCKMRDESIKQKDGAVILSPFCPICQYILVNHIAPERHPDLDKRYMRRRIYPA
jgi:hypothetical protein